MAVSELRAPSRTVIATIALLFVLVVPVSAEVADEGTFEATWSLDGSRQSIELDGKPMAAYRMTGPVKVRRSDGLATEFDSVCAGVSDEKTGGMARCTWTDENGDEVFLELTGKIVGSMGTSRETEGKIVGGTGKYVGLEGWISTDWLFWESAFEEGKITGRDTETRGGWRRPG
jgi:hypothetical protein